MTKEEYEIQVGLGLTTDIGMQVSLCPEDTVHGEIRTFHMRNMPIASTSAGLDNYGEFTTQFRQFWTNKGYRCIINRVWKLEYDVDGKDHITKTLGFRDAAFHDITNKILEFLLEKEMGRRKGSRNGDIPLATEHQFLIPLAESVGLSAHCDHVDMDEGSHIEIRDDKGETVFQSFSIRVVEQWLRKIHEIVNENEG